MAPGMRFTICPISSPKTRGSGGEHIPSPSPSHSGRCQKVITARGRGGQHSVIIMTIKHPEHSGGFQIALSLSPQCHSEGCCVALLSGRWLEAGRKRTFQEDSLASWREEDGRGGQRDGRCGWGHDLNLALPFTGCELLCLSVPRSPHLWNGNARCGRQVPRQLSTAPPPPSWHSHPMSPLSYWQQWSVRPRE